jgi:hypothetical protein
MNRVAQGGTRRRSTAARLTLADVLNAPELAVLDVLEHAAHLAKVALIAQHPYLLGDENGQSVHDRGSIGQHAAEVIDCAFALSRAVHRYRVAIANASTLRDDDLPF